MSTATELRRGVASLATLASADLAALWRMVDSPEAALEPLRDVLPDLVDTYGLAAASLAADAYDDARERAAVRGSFTAIAADIADPGTQALIGWAATEARDITGFRTLILGGTQRRIANFSRFTVQASSLADPASQGWVRVGSGACKSGWCDQYLDGEIRTVAYDFPAHDNCNCHAQPAW